VWLLGFDNLDGKLLRIIADDISTRICHIFNLSLLESGFAQAWREAKVILLPKKSKTCNPLVQFWRKKISDQIRCNFTVKNLTIDFQHAHREGHSTSTALTQMADNRLREIDYKKIVGAVLLDCNAALILSIIVCSWKNLCIVALHPLLSNQIQFYWSHTHI
jgi:hypothetical protein